MRENLMSLSRDEDGVLVLNLVRELTPTEAAASRTADSLLRQITTESGLGELTLALTEVYDAVAEVETAERGRDPRALKRIQRAVEGWLTAFRSFDDHTKRWLSKEFGKTDPAYTAFSEALSAEFDANFAYRLACVLRNVTTHSAHVLRASFSSRLAPGVMPSGSDAGPFVSDIALWFDGPDLAERFGKKMRAATRDELLLVTEHLVLRKVLVGVMLSCERAHCVLLAALWPRIEAATDAVAGFQAEASKVGGTAVFSPAETFESPPTPQFNLSLRENPFPLTLLAQANKGQADRVLGRGDGPERLEWQDFTNGGTWSMAPPG